MADNAADRPLVTFALFAYNQEKYIREAVEGAFAQTYEPLEIILSDDCSTDSTFAIMEEVVAAYKGPHRIILERNPTNLGREKFGLRVWSLLQQAKGEFIILAAGDDISNNARTEKLFQTWDANYRQAVCVHSFAEVIDEHGSHVGQKIGQNQIASIPLDQFLAKDGRGLLGATSAFSKELLTSFGPFPDTILMEDAALAFPARLLYGILFLPEPLVLYRRHSSNMTNGMELQSEERFEKYIATLSGQHRSYLVDYMAITMSLDPFILQAITKRLKEISEMRLLFRGGTIERLLALWLYAKRFPIKRKIYLYLIYFGLLESEIILVPPK